MKENPSVLEDCKRIIYIDANSFELKGEIVWTKQDKSYPLVKRVSDFYFSSFFLMDSSLSIRSMIPVLISSIVRKNLIDFFQKMTKLWMIGLL